MFSLYMNGQDKTNQIKDWSIWSKKNELMVTVKFHSNKSFTEPLDSCEISPKIETQVGFLSKEKDIYKPIDRAIEYGNKYIVVNYPNNKKSIL